RGLKIGLSDDAKEFLIEKGGDVDYGARPLRRSVEQCVEDPLSEELLRGAFEGKNLITVDVKELGDQKQLDFVGSSDENVERELAAVGAPAEGSESSEGESSDASGDE
ncbi:MAG: NDP-hexose 4-ketoreductase, partial [Planctomycetes bacterium]|nr:NDP-hexose 4-ketoreductase [Planctomycetota bacterium]